MKKYSRLLLLLIFIPLAAFDNGSLLNHHMPLLPNKTLDGKSVDENYFKGHVTLVTCMFIGCMGCMNEIGVLNKLKKEYAGDDRVQILCLASQTRSQMIRFNEDTSSVYGKLKKALKTERIMYTIQPACGDDQGAVPEIGHDSMQVYTMKSQCNTVIEKYGVATFPTNFYVDKNGIIRKIEEGGPAPGSETGFYDKVKTNIDSLLAE